MANPLITSGFHPHPLPTPGVSAPGVGPQCVQTDQGLTIIAEQMPVEVVNFSLWVHAGSAAEADAINGMAHFLEHMVFKGSNRLAPGEFEQLVEQRGGVTNASTSHDYTCFYSTVAPQEFGAIAPHQIDLVLQAQIPELDFQRERQVVLEEIQRAADNSQQRIYAQTMAAAFDQLPYRRPILGPTAVIQALAPAQMRTFHRRHYQPSNMTAVAVGNLPVETLIQTVVEGFENTHQRGDPRPVQDLQPEPLFQDAMPLEIKDARLTQARLVLVWRVPGIQAVEQTYPLDILARVLAHGRNSRLVQILREQKGLVSSVSASNVTYGVQGLFWIAATLPEENLAAAEVEIIAQVQRLQEERVEPALVQQIQRQVVHQFIFENETPASRAGLYGYFQAIAADYRLGLDYPRVIREVTPEKLQAAAQAHLNLTQFRVLRFRHATSST